MERGISLHWKPAIVQIAHTHIADTALCWQGVTINSPTQYDWLSSINLLKEYLGLSLEINHWIYVGVGGYAIPQRSLTPLSILHYFSIRIDFAFLQLPAGTLRDSDLKQSKRYRTKNMNMGKWIGWFDDFNPTFRTFWRRICPLFNRKYRKYIFNTGLFSSQLC